MADGKRKAGKDPRIAKAAALDRLAKVPEFREWAFAMLDDLCAYARDEGMLTDFGQGIRAAAAHIKNGMLVSAGASAMLADFARMELMAAHEAAKNGLKATDEKEKKRP